MGYHVLCLTPAIGFECKGVNASGRLRSIPINCIFLIFNFMFIFNSMPGLFFRNFLF